METMKCKSCFDKWYNSFMTANWPRKIICEHCPKKEWKNVLSDTLEVHIKDRDIDTILWHHCSKWMWFVAGVYTEDELLSDRKICEKEIQRRL